MTQLLKSGSIQGVLLLVPNSQYALFYLLG